ncbi:MAG: hypothetical protein Q9162_005761 [Coniocarpon cinnabarinum]
MEAAASIASLLDITLKAIKYVRSATGASKAREQLLEQLTTTQSLLVVLQDISKDLEKYAKAFQLLQIPLGRLSTTLKNLINDLHRGKNHQVLSALVWHFKESELREYMSQIERQKSLFILALQNDELALSAAIKDDTAHARKQLQGVSEDLSSMRLQLDSHTQLISKEESSRQRRLREKEYAEVVQWLSFEPFWSQQADTLKVAQQGTGAWLLVHPTFRQWLQGESKVLWCHGIPGAGKTVLTSIVIDHLRRRKPDVTANEPSENESITLWVYCNYRSYASQAVNDLLAALLSQVLQHEDIIPEPVRQSYVTHSRRATRPNIEELIPILKRQLEQYKTAFIVVDGLDESPVQENRERLVDALRGLGTQVRLLVTSRPISDIKSMFERNARLEIRADDRDIAEFLERSMSSRLRRFCAVDQDFKVTIISKITKAANGM